MSSDDSVAKANADLRDPEPVSFALAIFAALSGAAGLVIQTAQHIRELRHDRAETKKQLFIADRSLNRIDESYRSLISIFDEHDCLMAPFALGQNPIYADEKLRLELDRLQSNIFYGGRDLQNAFAELSSLLKPNDAEVALEIARTLDQVFQKAIHSKKLLEFMIELGSMLELITDFIYRLGERYEFHPTSIRIGLIRDTIRQLRNRLGLKN
jgi:hypothetical protein